MCPSDAYTRKRVHKIKGGDEFFLLRILPLSQIFFPFNLSVFLEYVRGLARTLSLLTLSTVSLSLVPRKKGEGKKLMAPIISGVSSHMRKIGATV